MFIERVPLRDGIHAVAVEWIAGNVYFIDRHKKGIVACAGMTQRCHAVLGEELDNPQEISLDPKSGRMFWTDVGQSPYIGMSYLDGHQRLRLVADKLFSPNGLAVDHEARRLYWADAGKLETILWTGGGRILLMHRPNSFQPSNLLVMGSNLYYLLDRPEERCLYSADKFSPEEHPQLPIARQPRTMRSVAPSTSESVFNPCGHTLCAYLCLLAGNQSFRCVNAPEVSRESQSNGSLTDLPGNDSESRQSNETFSRSSSSCFVPITISAFTIVMGISAVLYHWALKPDPRINSWTIP